MPRRRIVTNTEWVPGQSRIKDILSSRDEQTLAGWFILSILLGAVIAVIAAVIINL